MAYLLIVKINQLFTLHAIILIYLYFSPIFTFFDVPVLIVPLPPESAFS